MASIVKWIKIAVDLFDDEKILLISAMPESDSIVLIWIQLLCLAGKQNNSGVFKFNGIPYTSDMLATIFRRDKETVSNALEIFEKFGMIKTIKGTITIPNWGKHQTLDKIEAYNEYQRNYMREYRSKQKAIVAGETERKTNEIPKSKINSKTNISSPDKELNKDKDLEIKKDYMPLSSSDDCPAPINCDFIVKSFNSICASLPKVAKLTANRKKAITSASAILDDITFEQFFTKIESSEFLTGRKTDWRSDFDWIMKPSNITKILEGNYDNRKPKNNDNYSDNTKYENLKMEV